MLKGKTKLMVGLLLAVLLSAVTPVAEASQKPVKIKVYVPSIHFMAYILYLPLRFLAESVGCTIVWDSKTYTVEIISKNTAQSADHEGEPSTGSGEMEPAAPPPLSSGGSGMEPVPAPVSKPSYESIIQQGESQINNLRTSAEATFTNLLNRYKNASEAAEKDAILSEGLRALSTFDHSFDVIMADLQNKLEENGYPTDIIATYRQQYAQEKADQEKEIIGTLFP